jgi:hypothetical protein
MRRTSRPPRPSARTAPRPFHNVPNFISTSLVPPRAAMSDDAATRQMAEDMRAAGYREGGISADDLETLGFTSEQIDRLGRAAARQAHALSAMT